MAVMNRSPLRSACLRFVCGLALSAGLAQAAEPVEALLDQVIAGTHRSEKNRARDQYRHPKETLLFFGLKPDAAVVEISPGAGWYAEILMPVLRDTGRYAGVKAPLDIGSTAKASVDLVLTFRNVHNWSKDGTDQAAFQAFFDVLKPGGTLGVVEHRANPGTALEKMVESGYMTEDYVIALATKAGFTLAAKSEVNANPKDTKDHPDGVWSLPPTRRGSFFSGAKFLAIGESDRMTLKFAKP